MIPGRKSPTGDWYEEPPQWKTVWPQELWNLMIEAPLVVIDEIGDRENPSEHQCLCLKRLLDEREGRPLIAISNLSVEEIGRKYSASVASRLQLGTVTYVDGPDRRIRKTAPLQG
jgi:DNA replication protein DnaC